MRPVSTTATTARETIQDDFGNLLWQQEATEFIEKYPLQRRQRPQTMHTNSTLRPSVSAGALNKNATAITTVNKRASGGELLTTQQRHQRDLFSGDLGIPEIRTHVGSVVHTFETMALQRKRQAAAEAAATAAASATIALDDDRQPLSSKYAYSTNVSQKSNKKYNQLKRKAQETRQKIIQLSQRQKQLQQQQQQQYRHQHKQQQQQHQRKQAKFHQSALQHPHQEHILTVPISSTQTLAAQIATALLARPQSTHQRRSTLSLIQPSSDYMSPYDNVDDDYRKNLFATIYHSRTFPVKSKYQSNGIDIRPESNNYIGGHAGRIAGGDGAGDAGGDGSGDGICDTEEAIIVNEAFDGIFAGYSEDDDGDINFDDDETQTNGNDENMVSISEMYDNDGVFRSISSNCINILGKHESSPKKLAHKKGPPPPPPPAATATAAVIQSSPIKRIQKEMQENQKNPKMIPLAAAAAAVQKHQRSTTLTNLFERLKTSQSKRSLFKIPSDNLLKHDELLQSTTGGALHKFPAQLDLHREVEGAEATTEPSEFNAKADDSDFLRGSTLSQSFVHQLKSNRTSRKGKAPPPQPPPKPRKSSPKKSFSNATTATAFSVSPVRGVFLFPKRSKSSNELLLDDLNVQIRKYYRAHPNDDDDGAMNGAQESDVGLRNWGRFNVLGDSAEI